MTLIVLLVLYWKTMHMQERQPLVLHHYIALSVSALNCGVVHSKQPVAAVVTARVEDYALRFGAEQVTSIAMTT